MSGPRDYIARHRAGDIPHAGIRVVVDELTRLARMARFGPARQDVWLVRINQATLGRYVNLTREQVNRNLGIAMDLKVIYRSGYTYIFLDVVEHDLGIELCRHPQCRAEVRGRFRGNGRPRVLSQPAVVAAGGSADRFGGVRLDLAALEASRGHGVEDLPKCG